jgi:hypothetical protein
MRDKSEDELRKIARRHPFPCTGLEETKMTNGKWYALTFALFGLLFFTYVILPTPSTTPHWDAIVLDVIFVLLGIFCEVAAWVGWRGFK